MDTSFNMCSVDGDQSTNDTVLVFANGQAGGEEVAAGTPESDAFEEALTFVCTSLAKEMVRDGEGAKKLIEVTVDEAVSLADARTAAREISTSSLVKAMVHGNDPNWGPHHDGAGQERRGYGRVEDSDIHQRHTDCG